MKFFHFLIIIFLSINFIFSLDLYTKKELSFTTASEINGFITNYLTHETFLKSTEDENNQFESSIFFITGKEEIKSLYLNIENILPNSDGYDVLEGKSTSLTNAIIPNLYSVSSDYIYIPSYSLFNSFSSPNNEKSILFGFCNEQYYFSVYTFDHSDSDYTTQNFILQNYENYEEKYNLIKTGNKCSGSAYIGKNDFGDRVFVSNSYSIFTNDNNLYKINYDIKIFEYMIKTYEINYYIGKAFNIEIIDYSTKQQSNFDDVLINALNNLFNKEGASFIKCKIINSYLNLFLNIPYDKEIILLCLYYSKDLENSLPNEPKLSIRLDLCKNNIGSNDLNLISYITIKKNIIIDKDNTNVINYLFPDLITFQDNEGGIYVILKGEKNTEIYSVNLNINTLIINNITLILNKTYTNQLMSFTPREYIGSFYISEYDTENNILNIYTYENINKKSYEETKVELNDLSINNVIKIELTSISSYLLAILLITNSNAYIVFIFFPVCDPISTNKLYTLDTQNNININYYDLIPDSTLLTNEEYSLIFSYPNKIVDHLLHSYTNIKLFSKLEFNEDYLTNEEKDIYLNIEYVNTNYRALILKPKKHIENLRVYYNLYFDQNNNKYYSPTCSFLVNICHKFCATCSRYSTDDDSPYCLDCLSPYYYPLIDQNTVCKNINDIPIANYYFDNEDKKFKQCNEECKYCIGPDNNQCLKCDNADYSLSEENLNFIEINQKQYEYSNCVECNLNNYVYNNYNFMDLSVKVCLDVSINKCPDTFPFFLDDACYYNCKNSSTERIYGNPRNHYCVDECDNNYYFFENNTCVIDSEKCPEGFYAYELKYYCVKKCGNNLYHIKEEKANVDNEKYFEYKCEESCPIANMPYYFTDEENYKYCIPSCDKFEYYFGNDFDDKYDIYYKNTLVCFSKSQCNNYIDEHSQKKYVALIPSEETSSQKRICVTECKEISQYLLPQSFIDIENSTYSGIDCITECPEGYGNYSWTCIDCSSIYYYLYEKNCIKECPFDSYKISFYPYRCFKHCPKDFPYADNVNYICYQTIDEIPKIEYKCDKTKYLWYTDYDINNISFIVCLNDTDIYLTCDAVVKEFPYTNKATHECVKKCPDYTIQNEKTKFCELNLNIDLNFTLFLEVLLTHELTNTSEKNESNIIRYSRDANDDIPIIFYLFNYSVILEKIRNKITPDITIQETNGDIRTDPDSPFYYLNGTEFLISDQCENLLRETYGIPYYNEFEYEETIIEFVIGLKKETKEIKKYYIPNYLLGILIDIKRDNTSQVEYKLYHPLPPYRELNLGLCMEDEEDEIFSKVFINIEKKLPIKIFNLFDEVYNFYINNINENFEGKSSKKYSYDIFNKNSDFFASPCTPFSSRYNTDVLSKDRFEKFYTEINFCEENCTYLGTERSFKNNNFILVKCSCHLKDKFFKENEVFFEPNDYGDAPNYNIDFQTIKSNFICFNKIMNIKSIFTKENILGLITLLCFLLIIALYIIQCIISITHLEETLKLIRVGKYDHGLNLFLNVKDYLKEKAKRDECYRRRKELKKVRLIKEKPKNLSLIQAQDKIKRVENNVKRKFEGKEMLPDPDVKKDELELIQDRIKDLEDKLKLKYEKKGMKNKKIKIRIKEDPEDIKKINQEIKITKKRLEDLSKQRKEIELEKLKYHSFSSMGSLPPYPPKRVLSELPMLDEIDDDAEINSKENMVNINNINKSTKKDTLKDKNKSKKEKENKINNININIKDKNNKIKYQKENNKENKEEDKDKLSLNNSNKNKEEIINEEIKEDNKEEIINEENKDEVNNVEEIKEEEEKKESNLNSSWETYDSKDPEGKAKKEKEKLDKKNKEKLNKKNREIQKLLIEKRIKEIERRIELLPEEAKKQKKLLEKEKKKKEMLEKGLPYKEESKNDNEILNSENTLIKNEENNINNELTENNIPEENLSEMNEESENEEKISEKKTQNEIITVKKKKDEYFKSILKKKYKFKYMTLFYEENPFNFARDYSIMNFNDLFTSNDFFYIYVDVELNEMIYRLALKEDRRSFCSIYWSFIKYKNNFIFCITKDYFNLIAIKIAILIYSLSVYPFLTCLFINDNLIRKIYTESNKNQKHTILLTESISIIQYILSPIIIELIIFLLKKYILTEKDIIDFIHKKKYHSNYVLQEMVKGHDVRDVNDEKEKNEILLNIQNSNKKNVDKTKEKDAYFELDDKTLKEKSNNKKDYYKEYKADSQEKFQMGMKSWMFFFHDSHRILPFENDHTNR